MAAAAASRLPCRSFPAQRALIACIPAAVMACAVRCCIAHNTANSRQTWAPGACAGEHAAECVLLCCSWCHACDLQHECVVCQEVTERAVTHLACSMLIAHGGHALDKALQVLDPAAHAVQLLGRQVGQCCPVLKPACMPTVSSYASGHGQQWLSAYKILCSIILPLCPPQ